MADETAEQRAVGILRKNFTRMMNTAGDGEGHIPTLENVAREVVRSLGPTALDQRERVLYREMAEFCAQMAGAGSFNLMTPVGLATRYNELIEIRKAEMEAVGV